MPEIKNQRAIAEMTHHVIDFTIKSCTPGQKSKWIDIALHRDT
jgi:hypothetical protein